MNLEDQFGLEHLLFEQRKCKVCGQIKELINDFYKTRKDRGNVPSAYAYECKRCSIKRVSDKRKRKELVEIYPDDQEKSYFKILFKIDTAGLLYSFSVFDKSNSTFVYMINDFKEEELENTLFTFVPEDYPEIEVIDFR